MYVFRDPSPSTTDEATCYNAVRNAAHTALNAFHYEFERRHDLTERRGGHDPLTALERLELSAICSALADAFDRAADIWDNFHRDLPVASSYRGTAQDLRDDAALHEAVAGLAPSERAQAG